MNIINYNEIPSTTLPGIPSKTFWEINSAFLLTAPFKIYLSWHKVKLQK